ncbi:MAG: nucleotide exchange factor GrpE [Coriobacteriaceae bacterium]|nr:nucleotide exchange factor GrpE [Coriobacteriaceae bacterium]
MGARRHGGGTGRDSGIGPREDHPAEAPFTPPGAVPSIDPELEEDLAAQPRPDDLIEAARAEAAECRDQALRAHAEMENVRKRLTAQHADAVARAGERIVEALFPVIDDLERAIDHAVPGEGEMLAGLGAVHRKLLDVLKHEGCEPIDPFGGPFDPNLHNAVQLHEDAGVPDHTVVEVFQKGYAMHGRVLRPAMVVVSTGGPERAAE